MSYKINPKTIEKALKLGLEVKPSTNKKKKLDVYQNNKIIASIGQNGAMDFYLWIDKYGLKYARHRRTLYYIRHPYNIVKKNNVYTPDYLAKYLLW